MRIAAALLAVFLVGLTIFGQSADPSQRTLSKAVHPVVNEDQGTACVVTDDTRSLLHVARGISVTEPRQYTIFLGKGWAAEKTQSRKAALSNLFADPDLIDPALLADLGWTGIYVPRVAKDQVIDQADPIADLRIQSILRNVVRSDPLAAPAGDNVYVIYLEPSLTPRLGTLVGSKHYSSYYNAVNIAGARLRYVVVPYEQNARTMATNALNGLIALVAQPNCSIASVQKTSPAVKPVKYLLQKAFVGK